MNDVVFKGRVDFSQASFKGPVSLDRSIFGAGASFEAVGSEAAFSLADAEFSEVPNFISATFKGALRLDNVVTPRYGRLGWTPDRNASAHFRELKRRAVEAQDRDRELEFFAQEIRTARFHSNARIFAGWAWVREEKSWHRQLVWVDLPPWAPKVWSWRFWFGLAYGTFSDFGRSLWRPFFFWLALVLMFAVLYLGQTEEMRGRRANLQPANLWQAAVAYSATARDAWTHRPNCALQAKVTEGTDPLWEALYLSANLFSLGRGDTSRRTYGCLYGFEHAGPQAPPIIPYRVAVASTLQTLMSAILIFLFGLAVRNLLRLK